MLGTSHNSKGNPRLQVGIEVILQHLIDGIDVLGKSIQHPALRRRVKEVHGQTQHVLQQVLVKHPRCFQGREPKQSTREEDAQECLMRRFMTTDSLGGFLKARYEYSIPPNRHVLTIYGVNQPFSGYLCFEKQPSVFHQNVFDRTFHGRHVPITTADRHDQVPDICRFFCQRQPLEAVAFIPVWDYNNYPYLSNVFRRIVLRNISRSLGMPPSDKSMAANAHRPSTTIDFRHQKGLSSSVGLQDINHYWPPLLIILNHSHQPTYITLEHQPLLDTTIDIY